MSGVRGEKAESPVRGEAAGLRSGPLANLQFNGHRELSQFTPTTPTGSAHAFTEIITIKLIVILNK